MAKKKEAKSTSSNLKIQPLGDRVLVEREESEEVTPGGIVLPDTAKDKPTRRVLFSSYAGEPFKLGDREVLLMREEDILAVIE